MIIKKCMFCGKEFNATENKRKYCSKSCADKSMETYNKIKVCEYCHKEYRASSVNQKYCSVMCGAKSRRYRKEKICEYCHNTFIVYNQEDFEKRKFCSTKCSAKWRSEFNHQSYVGNMTEERRLKASYDMKKRWQDNNFREEKIHYMKPNNPSYKKYAIDKAKATRIKNNTQGFTGKNLKHRGGNGKLSPAESIVYEFLNSLGFTYNKAIPMTELRKKYPNERYAHNYKPDFTNESKKICIELDGDDHKTTIGKQLDNKKEYALNFYGYKVYRYDNEFVINNLDEFKNNIITLLGYRAMKVKDVKIIPKEDKVYDIEVEDNHNYFANNILVHNCKNPKSKQGQGILHLDDSIYKMGMTGTILVNNPEDLYCPMAFIGLVKPNKWLYDNEYLIKDDWGQVIGYQNMDKLHDILYKSSIRRTKDLLDLPPKIYKQEWIDFNKDEQDIFEQVLGQKNPKDLDKIEPITELMAAITRMRQVTVCSELITSKKVTSSKFERLKDILDEARINKRKVLVFCPFTEALKLGMNYFKDYRPKLVIGGMGDKVKEVVDEHENTEGFSVLFAQEATLGVGYTLKNTSIVVFLSPPWNQATYNQCIDRCHRIGQKETVQVIDLLIKDTYDEIIYDKLHGKGKMSSILVDGDKSEMDTAKEYFKKMNITFSEKKYEYKNPIQDGLFDTAF